MYGGYSSHVLVPHYKYLVDYNGDTPSGSLLIHLLKVEGGAAEGRRGPSLQVSKGVDYNGAPHTPEISY